MSLYEYQENYKNGRVLIVSGVFLLFDNRYILSYIGLIFIIFGILIMLYYKNKMIEYKKKEILTKIIEEELINILNKKPIENIKKEPVHLPIEIKPINKFGKMSDIYINNKINHNNINFIINCNINYDKITFFLDFYIFINKFENIINLKSQWSNNIKNNKLLMMYYTHYYNIISTITNINNDINISIAISYLIDDYNNNATQLDNIIKDFLIHNNKSEWINNKYSIKYMLDLCNNILNELCVIITKGCKEKFLL